MLDQLVTEQREAWPTNDHPDILATLAIAAELKKLLGKDAEAKALLASVIASRRTVLGAEHPETLAAQRTLSSMD